MQHLSRAVSVTPTVDADALTGGEAGLVRCQVDRRPQAFAIAAHSTQRSATKHAVRSYRLRQLLDIVACGDQTGVEGVSSYPATTPFRGHISREQPQCALRHTVSVIARRGV